MNLLWHCTYSVTLWCKVQKFISENIQCLKPSSLLWENVLFGFTDYPDQEEQYFYLINFTYSVDQISTFISVNLLIKKNNFMVLLTEICIYIDSIRHSVNRKL